MGKVASSSKPAAKLFDEALSAQRRAAFAAVAPADLYAGCRDADATLAHAYGFGALDDGFPPNADGLRAFLVAAVRAGAAPPGFDLTKIEDAVAGFDVLDRDALERPAGSGGAAKLRAVRMAVRRGEPLPPPPKPKGWAKHDEETFLEERGIAPLPALFKAEPSACVADPDPHVATYRATERTSLCVGSQALFFTRARRDRTKLERGFAFFFARPTRQKRSLEQHARASSLAPSARALAGPSRRESSGNARTASRIESSSRRSGRSRGRAPTLPRRWRSRRSALSTGTRATAPKPRRPSRAPS